jgi:plasmid stabilization system protein ParE
MYTITITQPAEQDLNSAVDYFMTVLKAPKAAQALVDEIEYKLQFISSNPLIYEIEYDDYLRERNIRSVLVRSHLVFYIVNQNTEEVIILRILYARRNWISILRNNNQET